MTITFYKQTSASSLYYTMHDRQAHLFSPYTFTSVWGTVLESGREKVFTFDTRQDMEKKLRFLMKKRISSGYKVLYSFSRNDIYTEIFNSIKDQQAG
ncbi:MAG: WGR domain-containing protein [Spirochaetales bacterium]|nr:WGR domain-containing protein [Spirochaetales bacterium]